MSEGLYFFGMSFVLAEMVLAQSLLAIVGLGLVGVVFTCILCIMSGLELFGLAVLMTYSSVFLFLSIFAVYLGGAWSAGGRARWGGVLALALAAGVAGFFVFALGAQSGWCGLEVVWEDGYAALNQVCTSAMTLVHMFFTRVFVLEALLLNVYILLGLVVALLILGLVVTIGGGLGRGLRLGHGLRQTRRLATPKSSRRSWRRRNSSIVREIKWLTAELVYGCETGVARDTCGRFTLTCVGVTASLTVASMARVPSKPFPSCPSVSGAGVTAPFVQALLRASG